MVARNLLHSNRHEFAAAEAVERGALDAEGSKEFSKQLRQDATKLASVERSIGRMRTMRDHVPDPGDIRRTDSREVRQQKRLAMAARELEQRERELEMINGRLLRAQRHQEITMANLARSEQWLANRKRFWMKGAGHVRNTWNRFWNWDATRHLDNLTEEHSGREAQTNESREATSQILSSYNTARNDVEQAWRIIRGSIDMPALLAGRNGARGITLHALITSMPPSPANRDLNTVLAAMGVGVTRNNVAIFLGGANMWWATDDATASWGQRRNLGETFRWLVDSYNTMRAYRRSAEGIERYNTERALLKQKVEAITEKDQKALDRAHQAEGFFNFEANPRLRQWNHSISPETEEVVFQDRTTQEIVRVGYEMADGVTRYVKPDGSTTEDAADAVLEHQKSARAVDLQAHVRVLTGGAGSALRVSNLLQAHMVTVHPGYTFTTTLLPELPAGAPPTDVTALKIAWREGGRGKSGTVEIPLTEVPATYLAGRISIDYPALRPLIEAKMQNEIGDTRRRSVLENPALLATPLNTSITNTLNTQLSHVGIPAGAITWNIRHDNTAAIPGQPRQLKNVHIDGTFAASGLTLGHDLPADELVLKTDTAPATLDTDALQKSLEGYLAEFQDLRAEHMHLRTPANLASIATKLDTDVQRQDLLEHGRHSITTARLLGGGALTLLWNMNRFANLTVNNWSNQPLDFKLLDFEKDHTGVTKVTNARVFNHMREELKPMQEALKQAMEKEISNSLRVAGGLHRSLAAGSPKLSYDADLGEYSLEVVFKNGTKEKYDLAAEGVDLTWNNATKDWTVGMAALQTKIESLARREASPRLDEAKKIVAPLKTHLAHGGLDATLRGDPEVTQQNDTFILKVTRTTGETETYDFKKYNTELRWAGAPTNAWTIHNPGELFEAVEKPSYLQLHSGDLITQIEAELAASRTLEAGVHQLAFVKASGNKPAHLTWGMTNFGGIEFDGFDDIEIPLDKLDYNAAANHITGFVITDITKAMEKFFAPHLKTNIDKLNGNIYTYIINKMSVPRAKSFHRPTTVPARADFKKPTFDRTLGSYSMNVEIGGTPVPFDLNTVTASFDGKRLTLDYTELADDIYNRLP